jgi:poxvirus D5 protein-like
MFKTQLFNKKAIAKKNPRIINVIDFMTARTNVSLKTMTDLREHVCELVTDYYQECYARALIENGGREPKNIKITVSEYVHLLLNIIPLASITPASKYGNPTNRKDPIVHIYDFDETSPTYGLYVPAQDLMMDIIFAAAEDEDVKFHRRIYETMIQTIPNVNETSDANRIFVKNGIFNKETKQLEPFTQNEYRLAKIQTNYNPNASSPTITMPDGLSWSFDMWLDELVDHDPDRLTQMWQIITAALNPGRVYNKCVIFYSRQGNNGKGTLGQVLKNIIGDGLYSSVNIKNFGVRFRTQQLLGKIVNIADENPVGAYIDGTDEFKAAITGDDIQIEAKGKDAYPMQVRMLNIQMLNGTLLTRDKSNSIYRRLLIVPFTHTFTGCERPYIKHDYMDRNDVKEYILKRALESPVITEFITTKENDEALYKTKLENNTVIEFLDEFLPQFKWDALPPKFLYELYKSWMSKDNANGKPVKKSVFIEYATDFFNDTNEWNIRLAQGDKITVGQRMDADEPLITEYNLTDYMDPSYKGSDARIKRAFTRPKTIRGFVRRK